MSFKLALLFSSQSWLLRVVPFTQLYVLRTIASAVTSNVPVKQHPTRPPANPCECFLSVIRSRATRV